MNNLSPVGWTAFDECDKRVSVTQTQSLLRMRSTMRMARWFCGFTLNVRMCDAEKNVAYSILILNFVAASFVCKTLR